MNFFTATVDGIVVGVTEYLSDPLIAFGARFFVLHAPAPPTPLGQTFLVNSDGMPRKRPNIWDVCIAQERVLHQQIDWKRVAGCRPPTCYHLDYEPYREFPSQGREMNKQMAIALPAPGSGDVRILSFMLPTGYDGILYGLLQKFAGGGFMNGSGDLTWRLQIGRRWVKNMSTMTTELGDYSGYLQLDEFIYLRTRQRVSMWVNVDATAGARLDPAGRVVVGLQGWVFPLNLAR
jgi:hypothetical protein